MSTGNKAVLVVEDDRDIAETLLELLRDEGFVVRWAQHGREALLFVAGDPPSAILLDLGMPFMNGWEFLDELRRRFPDLAQTPVVVMTASRDQPPAGVNMVLHKPFACDDLLRSLRRFGTVSSR